MFKQFLTTISISYVISSTLILLSQWLLIQRLAHMTPLMGNPKQVIYGMLMIVTTFVLWPIVQTIVYILTARHTLLKLPRRITYFIFMWILFEVMYYAGIYITMFIFHNKDIPFFTINHYSHVLITFGLSLVSQWLLLKTFE